MRKGTQNISLAYDVLLVNMYLFGGNEKRAKEIADSFANNRIYIQIKEDGSQPGELNRTIAFTYSIYNLIHIVDFCYLVRYWDAEYYSKYGARIDLVFSYLQHYAENPDSFPYQQIVSWKNWIKVLEEQVKR